MLTSRPGTRIGVIVAAGGTGSRFGRTDGKQLALLMGRPVAAWAIEPFVSLAGVVEIVVVCHPERCAEYAEQLSAISRPGVTMRVVGGGDSRQASVACGLQVLAPECEIVIVHDGARPLVTRALVQKAVDALLATEDVAGAIVGHPSVDTLKRVGVREGGWRVIDTPDRTEFWAVQTPQVFRAAALRAAHRSAAKDGFVGTDDSSLVERSGGVVVMVEGPRDNLKVTHAEDLAIAEAVLRVRAEEAEA